VLAAEGRGIGIVVEEPQVWPPSEPHLKPGSEQHAKGNLEGVRPSHGIAERCRGPVGRAHDTRHLGIAREYPAQRVQRSVAHKDPR
jgi:hypothetical protein